MTANLRGTEAAVLANYKKEDPSFRFLAESDEAFAARRRGREAMYRDCLKLPPKMFDGARLLDLGAGTGESAVFFGLWGADCTLVEINDSASARSREIFEHYLAERGEHRFVCSSLFDFESDERFDMVVSEGVIHHTADKQGGFERLASYVAPDGFLVLGVGNPAGCFQRSLQRVILFRFAQSDEEIVAVAERLFAEHIDRASRFGGRTRRAVIFDSFVNPKVDFSSVAEVLGWFREAGLRLYACWPPVVPALLGDSGMRSSFGAWDLSSVGAPAEAVWLAHDRDDAEDLPARLSGLEALAESQATVTDYVNDFQPGQAFDETAFLTMLDDYRQGLSGFDPFTGFAAKSEGLLDEIEALLTALSKGDLGAVSSVLATTKQLFRGTAGLGIVRYVGYRPETDESQMA